ncbi:hypothetical protein ABTX15_31220 [Micromonospora sp. NPDC094482]|uniref:hypothetical protein n=1 Tax=unclassified Micromonospora TaxID=2617518 RepID=UPI00332E1ED9
MAHHLLAVLVRATATVTTIDAHLARPMRLLTRLHPIDGYRLGGQVTGAWNPDYDPATDPNNWHTCEACRGTTRINGAACRQCSDAVEAGRPTGTVVPWSYTDWTRYPGDIVALPRLMHPGWRFAPGRTPIAWVDLAGVVWIGTGEAILTGTDTGDIPPPLRAVFRDLIAGRRNPDPAAAAAAARHRPTPADWSAPWRHPGRSRRDRTRFKPADWSVAVVDAHS